MGLGDVNGMVMDIVVGAKEDLWRVTGSHSDTLAVAKCDLVQTALAVDEPGATSVLGIDVNQDGKPTGRLSRSWWVSFGLKSNWNRIP